MDSKRIQLLFLPLLICLFAANAWAQADDYFAGDLQLRGLLGGKLKIEMLVQGDGATPFFSRTDKDCFTTNGSYYYRTQLKPISLTGRFCASNHTFYLVDQEGEAESERFEGKWVPATRKLTGIWTLKRNGKTMPFELSVVDADVDATHFQRFYAYLDETLQGEPDAEGAKIESAMWTAIGGKITGFAPNWSGYLEFLSPMRLEYSTSYTSTARSSYYRHVYQLLPTAQGLLLMVLNYDSNYDKGYDEQDQMSEGTSSCNVDVSILKYANGGFEDVTTAILPTGARTSSSETGEMGCQAALLSDALLLPGGGKVYWNGSAFVLQ
jgi:hypothetical protein